MQSTRGIVCHTAEGGSNMGLDQLFNLGSNENNGYPRVGISRSRFPLHFPFALFKSRVC